MTIRVDIVALDRSLFSGDVDMVTLPGRAGQMGILHGHAPLLTTLDVGEIVLHQGSDAEYVFIGGGVAEVRPDKVTILVRSAERAEDIDVERAATARERAERSLAEGLAVDRKPVMLAALRRSNLRLKVAQRRRHRERPHFEGG